MIYIDAEQLQDGLYNIKDGKIYKYKAKGGTVRTYELRNIVTCGECKYYIDNMCDCYSLYGDLSGDLIGVSFEPNEDFFCSYGSRSEKPNNLERSSE